MWIGHELGWAGAGVLKHHATLYFWGFALVGTATLGLIDGGKRKKGAAVPQRVELQSVLQSLPEAVFVFDCEGRIIDLNGVAERVTGIARRDLLGRQADTLSSRIICPDDDACHQAVITRALHGDYVRHERRMFRSGASGEPIELLISGSPMHDLSGRVIGALLVMQDVTELSALQRQVASSERHFAVGQMTAGLAHDFNNVLSTISEAIYVLESQNNRSEHDRSMLGIIHTAVHRGSELVGNIREYLRGNREVRVKLDLCRLLNEVLQLAQPLLERRKGISVVRHFEPVPSVNANPAELRRVFTNLVLNALEAMPEKGTLTVCCQPNPGWVMASVSDNGAGIPQEKQRMIFSPYYTTKDKGTGLGLAGARQAVLSQGGEIRFESSPGMGTTFYVRLPAADKQLEHHPSPRVA